MVFNAVSDLRAKKGSSLPAIRKYIKANFKVPHKEKPASFNAKSLRGLQLAESTGRIERTGRLYKVSMNEIKRMKDGVKRPSIGGGKSKRGVIYLIN